MVTAENAGRLNGEIQCVSLGQAGFLSLCTVHGAKITKRTGTISDASFNLFLSVWCCKIFNTFVS